MVVFKGPLPDPDAIVGCSTDPSTLAVCLQAVLRDKAGERRRLGAAQHYAETERDRGKAYNAYRPPEAWQ